MHINEPLSSMHKLRCTVYNAFNTIYQIQMDSRQMHRIQMHRNQIHIIRRYITKEYSTWHTIQNMMRRIQSI